MNLQSEKQFEVYINELATDPARQLELIDLLREDHSVYHQRGTTTVSRMRGWILLGLARITLPELALPFVLEELDNDISPYTVTAAAFALRSYSTREAAFAPFLVRAIANIRYRDEHVSLQAYGGYANASNYTTPLREILATLTWLGPSARGVVGEVESLREGATALGKKLQPQVAEALAALRAEAANETEVDCCQLPNSVRKLFSAVRDTRRSSAPIGSTVFEDQDGRSITFGEYFRGRPSIVVFFYTRCDNPLKCSLTITKLARIQELLESEDRTEQINTAGITYDPAFDLPERLKNYGVHRGVRFSERHRLLRSCDGLDALRRHFKLGVNFIESLVNRHRIEVYILDADGRIAASFERVQWAEADVVRRAVELLKENVNSLAVGKGTTLSPLRDQKRTRRHLVSPLFGTIGALALALFPKCPLCWAAYLSLFGIAGLQSIPYSPWLQPLFALLLAFNLTSVWGRSRSTGRMAPFYLVAAGAIAVIAARVYVPLEPAAIPGVILTLIGSLWGTLSATNRRQLARQ